MNRFECMESKRNTVRWLKLIVGGVMKQIGIVIGVIGGLIFMFGLVRFNSMQSQLLRLSGQNDTLSVFLLVVGGLIGLGGMILAINSPASEAEADAGTNRCLNCRTYNDLIATICDKCGHVLGKAAAQTSGSNVPTPTPSIQTTDVIEGLERLAALKERGMLSDEEFLKEKAKLLR